MTFKEFIRFSYGLIMGTSTPFLKPAKRFMFPVGEVKIDDELTLLMGGSSVCGVLSDERETLVINVNQGAATGRLRALSRSKSASSKETVVLTSMTSDFSGGLELFADAARILVGPASAKEIKKAVGSLAAKVESISSETVLEIAGERVVIVPVGPAATANDLAVFLEKRSTLFLGPLFYNRMHPILRVGPGLQPQRWLDSLEGLMRRFQPRTIVPAEGDTGTPKEVEAFLAYLKALVDPAIEFSYCRQNYDWMEIPGYTSLEENFDLLREKVKSHASLG